MKKLTASFLPNSQSTFIKRGDTHTSIAVKLEYVDSTPALFIPDTKVYLALTENITGGVTRIEGTFSTTDTAVFEISEKSYEILDKDDYIAELHIETGAGLVVAPMDSFLEVHIMKSVYWEGRNE